MMVAFGDEQRFCLVQMEGFAESSHEGSEAGYACSYDDESCFDATRGHLLTQGNHIKGLSYLHRPVE